MPIALYYQQGAKKAVDDDPVCRKWTGDSPPL